MDRRDASDPILSTQVPPEIAKAVRERAKRDDRTTSAYLRRVIVAHIEAAAD